jgi:ribosome-binding protein aMBF1 (putative translation factor)
LQELTRIQIRQENNSPSPLRTRRVALLGIAQRQIHIKFAQNSRKSSKTKKSLPTVVRTIGDWIHIKRREKNMTACHLAVKMGIATALIHSWENGTRQPDRQQMKFLAKLLGIPPTDDFLLQFCAQRVTVWQHFR